MFFCWRNELSVLNGHVFWYWWLKWFWRLISIAKLRSSRISSVGCAAEWDHVVCYVHRWRFSNGLFKTTFSCWRSGCSTLCKGKQEKWRTGFLWYESVVAVIVHITSFICVTVKAKLIYYSLFKSFRWLCLQRVTSVRTLLWLVAAINQRRLVRGSSWERLLCDIREHCIRAQVSKLNSAVKKDQSIFIKKCENDMICSRRTSASMAAQTVIFSWERYTDLVIFNLGKFFVKIELQSNCAAVSIVERLIFLLRVCKQFGPRGLCRQASNNNGWKQT